MLRKLSLIGGSLLALTWAAGCVGDLDGSADREVRASVGVTGAPSVAFTPRAPDASIFSSAATPLGWETIAERRHEEWRFANGEDTAPRPPDAIGGGPEDFDDED